MKAVKVTVSAIEMQSQAIFIKFIDVAGAEWEDQVVLVTTYGHASAQHPFDRAMATPAVNLTQIGGEVQSASDLKNFADNGYDPATGKVEGVKVNDDMRGTDGAMLAANAPANFADFAITATTGRVTAGTVVDKAGYSISGAKQTLDALNDIDGSSVTVTTNNDKTGYSLTQSFPANFASLVITAGGSVDSLTQGILNTPFTETTAGRIAGNFDLFFENSGAATSKTVDDVGVAGGGGGTDWTTTERSQIRYRLGVDGAATAPATNMPNLGDVGITQAGADKVWVTATRSLTDKAGFAISGTKTTLDALNDIDGSSVTVTTNNDKAGYALSATGINAILTTQMTEAYASDGTAPTLAEIQFMIWSALSEFSVSGSSITTRKLDGVTTAMSFTLDDNTNPTSRARSL